MSDETRKDAERAEAERWLSASPMHRAVHQSMLDRGLLGRPGIYRVSVNVANPHYRAR